MTIEQIIEVPGYRGSERRHDDRQRQQVTRMTRSELERALYTDDLTGVGNRRSWERWMAEVPTPYFAIIDVDGLKWINDNMGHGAGDALLRAVALVLLDIGLTPFRVGGDEFYVPFGHDLEAWEKLGLAQRTLRRASFEVPDGWATGARFSFGVGPTESPDAVERRLRWMKDLRVQMGMRAERGEQPPGLTVTPASEVRLATYAP